MLIWIIQNERMDTESQYKYVKEDGVDQEEKGKTKKVVNW